MCAMALVHSRVRRVVYGAPSAKTGRWGGNTRCTGSERQSHYVVCSFGLDEAGLREAAGAKSRESRRGFRGGKVRMDRAARLECGGWVRDFDYALDTMYNRPRVDVLFVPRCVRRRLKGR